ncbi:sulfatase [Verrucomicrobiota bacterium]|nr:sulfatase [Verrucomicrobiota bacterium]
MVPRLPASVSASSGRHGGSVSPDTNMNQHWLAHSSRRVSRREMLWRSSAGFAGVAMAGLLGQETRASANTSANPLANRPPLFTPKAKRVIFLFMHGGPSQVDTFDYKPLLARDHGKPLPFAKPRIVSSATGNLLKSPWEFRHYGQSGIPVSDLFPNVGRCADDICFINGLWCSNSRHGAALLELHTGSDTFIRPSMGSWITYGLGTENQNLPGFITICPTLGHGGVNAWSSSFLPAVYQGTPIGYSSVPSDQAKIPFIANTDTPRPMQRLELDLLRELNEERLRTTGPDSALEARINSFELAFRMQMSVPEVQDISGESEVTQKLYGLDDPKTRNFGRQCLMARRFAERGVRFVQVTHSYKWDQHGNLQKDHAKNAAEVDQPIAALLLDLKHRGLLDDTLVIWGGEFGRTPTAQGNDGRDHHPQGYTMWLAGGGVKTGLRYGATDDYGYYAVKDKVHMHDLHATILHLLGLDHERLTYRFAGRDFRLTDVAGHVVRDIIA